MKRPEKQITSFAWTPLHGVLKLNSDGTFLKEHKGGYGGVIRNGYSTVLYGLLGSLECVDANEAEVYAMLMGSARCVHLKL